MEMTGSARCLLAGHPHDLELASPGAGPPTTIGTERRHNLLILAHRSTFEVECNRPSSRTSAGNNDPVHPRLCLPQ